MSENLVKRSSVVGFNLMMLGTIFLLVVNAWFLDFNFRDVRDQEHWVKHTEEVIDQVDRLLYSMKDAEANMRGYLLTNNLDYLEPYRTGVAEVEGAVEQLKYLTTDNPTQQNTLVSFREVVNARLKVMADNIDDFRRGAERGKVVAQLNHGRSIMSSLKEYADRLRVEEERLLKIRAEKVGNSESSFFWSLILTTALSSLVIGAAVMRLRRNQMRLEEEAEQKARDAQLRSRVAQLSQLVAGDLGLKAVGQNALNYISEILNIPAANIYIYDDDTFRHVAGFGSGLKSSPEFKTPEFLSRGENLLAEAAQKKEIFEVSGVPERYFKISSSLGSAQPNHLTFLPFEFQGAHLGAVEMGSFAPLSNEQKSLLMHFREPLGVSINAARARETTKLLLEETQQQSEELQAQQEELRVNNEELEQQAKSLENQTEELTRSSEYKSDFLAKMSHELRTPLNSLLILATLLIENKDKNLNERQVEFARSIHGAGNDLLELITDILDLSKIEARKLSIRPEQFEIGEMFETLKRTFEPQASAKNLTLNMQISAAMKHVTIFTDQQRLEQILKNFIVNAVKFTEQGSVTLSVVDTKNPEFVGFAVTDTGIGIAQEKQQQIFEAFEQADSSISRKFGGTGLGLTISRELAALLGGTIKVTSELGKGSTFTVTIRTKLPISADQALAIQTKTPNLEQVTGAIKLSDEKNDEVNKLISKAKGQKRTILIVEDDLTFSSSVAEAAKAHGYSPIEVADGKVALILLQQFTPTAILLDIKLPSISGMGLLEIIKQMPQLRHVPIHMISALEYQQNALRMGAVGYLSKPVTIDKVRSALTRIEQMVVKKVKKVMLIEDDERQSMAIRELISGPDIQVIEVKSATEALKKVSEDIYDCVIVDLQLPDYSGFELLDKFKSLKTDLPPIVIYTAREITREEEERLRKVSQSIIIKGAKSPERLLDEVNLFLHRVETLLPDDKKRMLSDLRSNDKSFQGKTALIADDDIRNVFALTSALEGQGFAVRIARDGIEALQAVKDNDDIDLILMDIMMPKMDGYQCIREIRKLASYKNKPIIALTAKAMKEDHEKCIQAGANDYLAKPINLGNLMSVMKVWLAPKGVFS